MELFHAAFSMVNLPFTVMLMMVLLYWLAVIFGALDISALDFDLEVDADADAALFQSLLAFLNVGELPLMLVASIFVVCAWTLSILANYYLDNHSILLAAGLAIPNLVISALLTKVFSRPFLSVFKHLNRDPDGAVKAVGSLCTLLSDADAERMAQAEVETKGAPLLLMVRTREGASLAAGARALVIEKDPEKDIYIVEPFEDWE